MKNQWFIYIYSGNLMAQLIVSMGIIVNNNCKQIKNVIFNGWWNAYTWHDHICYGCTLLTKYLLVGCYI
jgi:hypothetical protein